MLETTLILSFVAFLTLLSSAAWTLFLFFWARRLLPGTRTLAAALLGSAGLLVPVLALGGGLGGEGLVIMLAAVALLAGVVGLPTALLANRKLERIGIEPAAAFD